MRSITALLLLSASLYATSGLAAPAALKCTGADMGPHFMYLWVDYDGSTVSIGRVDTTTPASSGLKASISPDAVAWDAAGSSGDVFHYSLNRKTGDLAVTAENYEGGPVTCNPAAP